MSSPTLFIRNASLAYKNTILFENLNLILPGGKWSCLLGPSGVGKTTLLRMIANLFSPETEFRGEIYAEPPQILSQQISYMGQTDLLMPWLTAYENTVLSARINGKMSTSIARTARELFEKMGLKKAIHKYPRELSGGMRQRVALIRTFLQNKPIVLMDEPFSALDTITRFQLQTLAAELLKNKTVLFITHDPVEALRLADEIFILSGHPAVITAPVTLHTSTPRDPADPEFIQHQAGLFHALMQAKEASL